MWYGAQTITACSISVQGIINASCMELRQLLPAPLVLKEEITACFLVLRQLLPGPLVLKNNYCLSSGAQTINAWSIVVSLNTGSAVTYQVRFSM